VGGRGNVERKEVFGDTPKEGGKKEGKEGGKREKVRQKCQTAACSSSLPILPRFTLQRPPLLPYSVNKTHNPPRDIEKNTARGTGGRTADDVRKRSHLSRENEEIRKKVKVGGGA